MFVCTSSKLNTRLSHNCLGSGYEKALYLNPMWVEAQCLIVGSWLRMNRYSTASVSLLIKDLRTNMLLVSLQAHFMLIAMITLPPDPHIKMFLWDVEIHFQYARLEKFCHPRLVGFLRSKVWLSGTGQGMVTGRAPHKPCPHWSWIWSRLNSQFWNIFSLTLAE